ncbi:MAG TPA: DUF488 domain-containing protein [Armatimonadota bacterium]|nr:DUF488 domain-containing protein [Armatimonadota bacterium]HOM72226.1 DUF488 domain-containing protein [Armatimonadota bacterium]HOP79295.1 DUF488 domain-containing protein [Armatimonadota bacterium]HPP74409.1 DUF488 domain-containing protein [Armatimonadota bacterium]
MTIFTIGSSGKGLRKFAELLLDANVDCVIDIRLHNTSQLAGYAKQDDLEFVLELLKIAYEHHIELAPDLELFEAYRKSKNWDNYAAGYNELIIKRDMLSVGKGILSRYKRPCLLCSEDAPSRCHRILLAEYLAKNIPGLEVKHLR